MSLLTSLETSEEISEDTSLLISLDVSLETSLDVSLLVSEDTSLLMSLDVSLETSLDVSLLTSLETSEEISEDTSLELDSAVVLELLKTSLEGATEVLSCCVLELSVELAEMDLEMIEHYLSKMEDSFYDMDKAYALMGDQRQVYEDILNAQKEYVDSLSVAEIGTANFKEGIKEARSAILDNLSALYDLDKEMIEYYQNTLDAAGEEIGKYTDKMEHLTSVLDHYSSLMDILGMSKDYKAMNTIL